MKSPLLETKSYMITEIAVSNGKVLLLTAKLYIDQSPLPPKICSQKFVAKSLTGQEYSGMIPIRLRER